ncbi:MAG TPA: phosphatase PAP2 family protein [Puia sp.]|nr:phosphatase PAP2 family protein [Puia sp.]
MDDSAHNGSHNFYSLKNVLFSLIVSAGYLLLSMIVVGFKADQLMLMALFNAFYFISSKTRKFILAFSVFIVYWIIFDYMKAFPNYRYHDVHIESLYNDEKNVFGIRSGSVLLTPNEYFLQHQQVWLNVITGVFYLCWVPLPLAFAAILFFKNKKYFFYFSLTFLLVNILGFIVYYIYPAAPPWYVQQYGFDFIPATHGNTAGLQRFDDFFHARIFAGIYSKSSNVFAAMPSLHASYPLLVLFYGLKYKFGYWNYLFFTIMIGIWFAAVYNSHHYVLDVLAGIACGFTGLIVFLLFAEKTSLGKKIIDKMIRGTS